MKVFPLCLVSRYSSKSGKPYTCLAFDLGYRYFPISFRVSEIAELIDCSPSAVMKCSQGLEQQLDPSNKERSVVSLVVDDDLSLEG